MAGVGLMVMVKEIEFPVQLPNCGVTVIVAVCGSAGLVAVNEIFPVPEAGSPMSWLLLVHSNVAPEVPLKLTVTVWPPQAT